MHFNVFERRPEVPSLQALALSCESSGRNTLMPPELPTTLGRDRVTPNSSCKLPIGITARSSRNTISAMRADNMPIPYRLASCPSMMVMLA